MNQPTIVIRGAGSVSGFGSMTAETSARLASARHCFERREFRGSLAWVSPLSQEAESEIEELLAENERYASLDRSVQLAILAARKAVRSAGWQEDGDDIAVNIGSSRGATSLFEHYHTEFLRGDGARLSPHCSPRTTLGNISSWVLQDLKLGGFDLSHSVTCSTGIQALANAAAWLRSGMARRFLAGAAEAPLTPFTVAQMQALRIYTPATEQEWPCRPCQTGRVGNTFALGEGAAVFALELVGEPNSAKDVCIEGVGFASEQISTESSISGEGYALEKAMRNALAQTRGDIDLVLMHAPGTELGDRAEITAITAVFGAELPAIASCKHLIGHALGASGALALHYAVNIILTNRYNPFPYPLSVKAAAPERIRRILINSAGFGGNAASVIVSNTEYY